MASERKYTDRDVRENSTLRQIAEEYVVDYGGDFEPLVNAVRMMEEGEELPTNIIRVVLNCMRHDYKVAESLPEPKAPKLELVVDKPKKQKRSKIPWEWPCDDLQSHDGHGWREPGQSTNTHWCDGVAFPINRRDMFWTKARSHEQFVLADTGKLIHMASQEEQGSGVLWWPRPDRHSYGMAAPQKLAIKTLCRYPSIIVNPILLNVSQANSLVVRDLPEKFQIKFCPHCINEIETEADWWETQSKKY